MQATNAAVQIEVEGRRILLVLDRKTDCLLIPWQDCHVLAATFDLAIADLRDDTEPMSRERLEWETGQIMMREWKGMVALVFEHTDRVRFSWWGAAVVRDALRRMAQDVELASRDIHIRYDRFGEPFALR